MRASQIRLALLLALLLAFPAVAQFIGGGSIGAAGGGGSFTGGTVSGSPVVFSAPASASNMVQITGVTGQTGDYFAVQGEDDSTPRFRLLPNGTSGSLWFSYRPITTGAAQLITDIGTTSQSVLNVTNNSKLNAPNGFDVAGTISSGALTAAGPFSVASSGAVSASQVTSGTPIVWRVPTAIATASITLPTCSASTNAGQIFYVDDSDDANSGELCVCRADSGGTYSNVKVADNSSACVDP